MMILSLNFSNISISTKDRWRKKTPVNVNAFCSSAATVGCPANDRFPKLNVNQIQIKTHITYLALIST